MSVLSAIHLARTPVLGFVVVGLFWGSYAAYVPVLKARLGAGDGQFGLLMLGQAVGLLAAMWLAPLVDRRLGPRAMQVAAALMAAAWLLPGLSSEAAVFVLVLSLLGATSGLLDVIMNARVSELEARHARTLMNAAHGMFSVAYMCAALVCAVLRDAGVPPAAAFAGFAAVALVLALFMRTEVAPMDAVDLTRPSRYPLRPVLICGAIVLVAFMAEATAEAWSALHIERTLGGNPAQGALGPATLGLTMAIGRFGGQALSARVSDLALVIGAAVMSACGALLAATAPSPAMAYLGFAVLGLGVSVIGPLGIALAGRLVAPRYRTDAIAKAAVIGFAGFFVAPVLMGGMSELFGLRAAFAGVGLVVLLAIPLALTAYSLQTPSKSAGT